MKEKEVLSFLTNIIYLVKDKDEEDIKERIDEFKQGAYLSQFIGDEELELIDEIKGSLGEIVALYKSFGKVELQTLIDTKRNSNVDKIESKSFKKKKSNSNNKVLKKEYPSYSESVKRHYYQKRQSINSGCGSSSSSSSSGCGSSYVSSGGCGSVVSTGC